MINQEKEKSMKALVLLSGGLDSATALGLAIDRYGSAGTMALSVSYGQKHDKEIKAARAVAEHYGITLKEIDLSMIFTDSNSSLLKNSDAEVPEGSYAEQLETGGSVTTYVPYRNGLFLSVAASMALGFGCESLWYGAHADDYVGGAAYPDCSPAFHRAISSAIEEGSGRRLTVEAPFIDKTKGDVVRIGLEIVVPYELTWSCYAGGEHPCGKCATCIDRAKAFAENGEVDPALNAVRGEEKE